MPRVRVLDLLVPGAVRVVEEHEADGHGSNNEEDGVEELEAPRGIFVHERRGALRQGEVLGGIETSFGLLRAKRLRGGWTSIISSMII